MKKFISYLLLLVLSCSCLTAKASSQPIMGQTMIFAGNFCPRGWAKADGQLLPISQNTALFSLYGTTFGGDGRTTFALPDLRGRVSIHLGRGPGLTNRPLGQKLGIHEVTLTQAQIPSHKHTVLIKSGNPSITDSTNKFFGEAGIFRTESAHSLISGNSIANVGGNQAHENTSPVLGMMHCVALTGEYPSRP